MYCLAVNRRKPALDGADLVVSATTTSTPFVKDSWLVKGIDGLLHRQEPGDGKRSLQTRRQVRRRQLAALQEQIRHAAHDQRELSERKRSLRGVAGTVCQVEKPGRQSDEERIFIPAIGLVNQDIAMANTIYQSAVEKGIGTRLLRRTDLID